MDNPNFKEFVNYCENLYKIEYFPKLCETKEACTKEIEIKNAYDSGFSTLGKILDSNFANSAKFSNDISLNYLEIYHNWLLKNYDIKPKED